ncbi:MAG: hypothetical protein U0270_24765 [Labilithrix sp.]
MGRAGTWKHAAVLGGVVFLVFACGGIDGNELHCEEAISHLEECCDGLDARRFQCDEEDACGQRSPDFFDKASECIRDRSCEQLRAQGKCAAMIKIASEPYPSNNPSRIETEACK